MGSEAHLASILGSLTANLTITERSDWEQFLQRLNHLVQTGRVRRVSAMKRSRADDEEWYLDPETDDVYVYGPPDWPFLPTWEKVDVALRGASGMDEHPTFGGEPGGPVPKVGTEDVKTVWQILNDGEARHPGYAIGLEILRHACRPEANVEAVSYRTMLLGVMSKIVPEQLARFMRDGQPDDSVFRAAAKIPVEWIAAGVVRKGLPFDVNEFLRLCGEESQTA